VLRLDESLIVCNPARSLAEGAVILADAALRSQAEEAADLARKEGVSMTRPGGAPRSSARCCTARAASRACHRLLRGAGEKRYKHTSASSSAVPEARDLPRVRRRQAAPEALRDRGAGRTIAEVSELPLPAAPWPGAAADGRAGGPLPAPADEQEREIAEDDPHGA
jgi:hypothetical protein